MEIIAQVKNGPTEEDGKLKVTCSVSVGTSQGETTVRVPFGTQEEINNAIKSRLRDEFGDGPSDGVTLFGGAV